MTGGFPLSLRLICEAHEKLLSADFLGSYGYDANAGGIGVGGVWAVVDYGGTFTAVPEPTTALAGLLLTAGLLRRRRRGH